MVENVTMGGTKKKKKYSEYFQGLINDNCTGLIIYDSFYE